MRKYLKHMKMGMLLSLEYKKQVIFAILSQIISIVIMYYFWSAVVTSAPETLNGFASDKDFLTYIVVSLIFTSAVSTFISFEISDSIKTGDIAMDMVKPQNFILKHIAFDFGGTRLQVVVMTTTLIVMSLAVKIILPISSFEQVIAIIFSLGFSYLITCLFSVIFGFLVLITENSWGLFQLKNITISLFSGALIPLTLFPKRVQEVFNFLPFKQMIFTPTMLYIDYERNTAITSLSIQILWVVILAVTVKLSWELVFKKRIFVVGG